MVDEFATSHEPVVATGVIVTIYSCTRVSCEVYVTGVYCWTLSCVRGSPKTKLQSIYIHVKYVFLAFKPSKEAILSGIANWRQLHVLLWVAVCTTDDCQSFFFSHLLAIDAGGPLDEEGSLGKVHLRRPSIK